MIELKYISNRVKDVEWTHLDYNMVQQVPVNTVSNLQVQ
jgi:hypothetical protein